ncbi:hypothetical protein, partial [Leptospira alexanderi]|uniref:hypothetical protein n=1 Tax=Leptospira alexanderi TaxID=100053 RepID=UPI0020149492
SSSARFFGLLMLFLSLLLFLFSQVIYTIEMTPSRLLERKKIRGKTKKLFDMVIDSMQNGNPRVAVGFGRAICDRHDADLELMNLASELERLAQE